MKALRIHPNPFVTAGFLVAFCMLLAFLYGLPMLTSMADEREDEDATGTWQRPGCHYDEIED